uniref:Uncharacterized protein n=1 Tax=Romanomermis culicivorax TaxID=13658 RepID=A0A915HMQ2_ROMCU
MNFRNSGNQNLSFVPNLINLVARSTALHLFRCSASRNPDRVRKSPPEIRKFILNLGLPSQIREEMLTILTKSFHELYRWYEKHSALMVDDKKKFRRSQHLKLCYDLLLWNQLKVCIEDYESAMIIMRENENWPQFQFQFACAYVQKSILDKFDQFRIRTFKKKLCDHPLYDFWFRFLLPKDDDPLFDPIGVSPKQTVSFAFQWAMDNGFYEFTKFLWNRTTDAQRDYMGMLKWRHVVTQAQHSKLYRFLCCEMCAMNHVNIRRINCQIFAGLLDQAVSHSRTAWKSFDLNEDAIEATENLYKQIEFVLAHSCDQMIDFIFRYKDFHFLSLVLQRKNLRVFHLFKQFILKNLLLEGLEHCKPFIPEDQVQAAINLVTNQNVCRRFWWFTF